MQNGYGAGHVFCLSKAETFMEISVAIEFLDGVSCCRFYLRVLAISSCEYDSLQAVFHQRT